MVILKMVIVMTILITGALSGLGYQYAKELAKRGHIVYAGVENEQQLQVLNQKILEEKIILFPIVLQLLDKTTWPDFSLLDIDVLILQAGIGEGGSILEIDQNRWQKTYETNVFGNVGIIQQFLRILRKSNKQGKLFITSSLAAFLPFPYLSSYTSTKIALYAIAKTLVWETKLQKIPVAISVIMPGAYATGFNDVMIENKAKDLLLLPTLASKITFFQKIWFALTEQHQTTKLCQKVVRAAEGKYVPFVISAPLLQSLTVKLYRLYDSLLH